MNQLQKNQTKDIALGFRWRDSDGNLHEPEQMETRHLFHTVRMIWNHSVPPVMRTGPHRRHDFGSFYTPEYMRAATKAMLPVLLAREDIEPGWKRDIDWMRGWAQRQEGREIFRIDGPQLLIGATTFNRGNGDGQD